MKNISNAPAVFTDIYKNRKWRFGSGSGSRAMNTKLYRKFLQDYMKKHGIKTVLDFGCGDWQSSKLISWKGIDYIGVDAVKFLVDENQRKYGKKDVNFKYIKNWSELPKADLIIMKDVLQHWPQKDVIKFLPKIKKYPHNLITNTLKTYDIKAKTKKLLPLSVNKDIPMGYFTQLDFSKTPYKFKFKERFRHQSSQKHRNSLEIKQTVEFI